MGKVIVSLENVRGSNIFSIFAVRHLVPFWWRQRMTDIVRRRSLGGVSSLGRQASTKGSNMAHSLSSSVGPFYPNQAEPQRSPQVQATANPPWKATGEERNAITCTITTLPEQLRRSLTRDQGAEMAQHPRLRLPLGTSVLLRAADPVAV